MHIQLRGAPLSPAIRAQVEAELSAVAGVVWARVNAYLGRVVVHCKEGDCDTALLLALLDEVERRHGIHARSLDDAPFPGDPRPFTQFLFEMSADVASFGISQALRVIRRREPRPVELDFAALVAVIESTPALRVPLDRILGADRAELCIDVTKALLASLRQGTFGLTASMVKHSLRLRELRARRDLWIACEPALCADAHAHAQATEPRPLRPRPLPDGPIERYVDKAIPATLSAFAFSYATVRTLGGALSPLFAGLPGPAHLGREAFASHLGLLLARRGTLVFDPQVLRLLDRIDCVAIDAGLLAGDVPGATRLVRAVRAADLHLVVAGDLPASLEWIRPDEALSPAVTVAHAIRALQSDGRAVCFIGHGPPAALAAADCGVGMFAEADRRPPWGADLVAAGGLDEARFVIEAVSAARRASHQSVSLALVEAATSVGLSFAGLKVSTTRRIMHATSLAAIAAMGNGVRIAHQLSRLPEAPLAGPEPPWHAMEVDEVLARFGTGAGGLSAAEATARFRAPHPVPSAAATFARMVGEELASPLAPVLAAGAGLSALVGSVADAALISSVVIINGLVGGGQRYRAERAVGKLRRRERRRVRVIRDGHDSWIDITHLVPGDVVELFADDMVPADCRVIEAEALEVNEAPLAGESMPVVKTAAPVKADAIAERASMLYEGTSIAAGRARAVVVAVGSATEARRAAATLGDQAPARGVEKRLNSLAWVTAPAAVASGLAITASGFLRKRPTNEVLGAGVGLAVAAVPEGLPVLATLSQLAAARRLSEIGALVRDPRALEALGRVDVLCADKTGTLTEGRIRLAKVSDGETVCALEALEERCGDVLAVALRATPQRDDGDKLPHLTDQALADGAQQARIDAGRGLADFARVAELPFEPSRGFHAGFGRFAGGHAISVKGAPEVVLPRCTAWHRDGETTPIEEPERRRLLKEAIALARQGLRVLAVAERVTGTAVGVDEAAIDQLAFRGFIGFADPVHPSARASIAKLRRAGVRPVMVTGDHPSTANAIAAELGLLDENGVLTGPELELLDDDALSEKITGINVFARTTPAHKVRIIRALQARGRVVAMTGDGANDSPAIHLADAGIAIGSHAASAAREAADVVVTDGRLETIVDAILEGRALWPAVRDAVSVLVGGNLGEIAFTLFGSLINGNSPLNVRQLLLVNLVTDTLPALALALRPPWRKTDEELLREGPEASLGAALIRDVLWRGTVTAGAAQAAWLTARLTGGTRARASTVALVALTGAQLGQTLVAGGQSPAVLATSLGSMAALLAVVETPMVSRAFGCRPLGPLGLLQAGTVTAAATGVSVVAPRLLRTFGRGERT